MNSSTFNLRSSHVLRALLFRFGALSIIMFALFLVFASSPVHAVAIGVNKASINFDGVLRGGYAEDVLTVTTDSEELVDAQVQLEGEAADWLNFSAKVFNFSRDQPYQLHVIMQPPLDAQIQDYSVNLTVITGGIAHSTIGKMGTSVRASFRIPIALHMTGTERLLCTGAGATVYDTEKGRPLDVAISILNRGNVRINPNITIEVWDKYRNEIVSTQTLDFGSRILPTTTGTITKTFTLTMDPSQYWAVVKVPLCDYTTMQSFDVLEPGGIKDDGELLRIDAPAWANTGDIIPIHAIFRNKGARGVRAVFKGTISRADNNQVVKVINTDEYIVDPDATASMETFFNPTVGGQYVVAGKVFYNNKLTVERSTLINVNGAPIGSSRFSSWNVLLILIILILILLILIRRRKRSKMSEKNRE